MSKDIESWCDNVTVCACFFTARCVCIAWTMLSQDVRLSVCLSQSDIVSYHHHTYFHRRVPVYPRDSSFSIPNFVAIFRRGPPPVTGASDADGVWKKSWFTTNISLYLGNDTKYGHSYHWTLIGTRMPSVKWCHFQRPWTTLTTISRWCHSSMLNISETVRDTDSHIITCRN